MTAPTPLHTLFDDADARWERYGPTPTQGGGAQVSPVDVAAMFDFVDVEYAALRKACALLDQPHRGTLVFTGGDRLAFLNRMVTQELKDARPFQARRAFWLNRKGRIDADLRLIVLEDRVIADVDLFAAARAVQTLESYIIADDVAVQDASRSLHRLALHGPGAAAVLAALAEHIVGPPVERMQRGEVCVLEVAGHRVTVDRWDSTGEIGLEMTLAAGAVVPVFQRLLEAAHAEGRPGPAPRPRLRPIGWHAYNVARIEAGTPLYMIDFGPDALPAETSAGVLNDRVSFKKGCYLGQEIVARMHALGQPKQVLVGLKFDGPADGTAATIPAGGAPVFIDPLPNGTSSEPIGTVASATTSPMLGGAPVAFAMVKQKHATGGARVLAACVEHPEAAPVLRPATVQDSLAFWSRPGEPQR